MLTTVALDMQLYLSELLEQRGIFARGLAHPITFNSNREFDIELRGRTPGLVVNDKTKSRRDNNNFAGQAPGGGSLENFGAVPVTPRNYYRLLQSGQNVLLFPGGAKEALGGDPTYQLQWPTTKTDFVRTAARFNATIVPVSAIGMVESFNVVLESKDILNLPFIGEWARQQNNNMTQARYDSKPGDEVVGFPLAVPTLPKRNYFLFGKSVDTSLLDPNDEKACADVYKIVQNEVRQGIDDLLVAKEQDPYQDTIKRLTYERILRKRAPTFPIDILNQKR